MKNEIAQIITNVSKSLGREIPKSSYQINILELGKTPSFLPKGKMGIYLFKYKDRFLKIGKAGSKSGARFVSQHYSPNSSRSNLAKSLLEDQSFRSEYISFADINENNIGDWIRDNCQRIEIIIDESLGKFALSLIEAILHYKYQPKYEGH